MFKKRVPPMVVSFDILKRPTEAMISPTDRQLQLGCNVLTLPLSGQTELQWKVGFRPFGVSRYDNVLRSLSGRTESPLAPLLERYLVAGLRLF